MALGMVLFISLVAREVGVFISLVAREGDLGLVLQLDHHPLLDKVPQRAFHILLWYIIHVPRALETASLVDGKVELVEYKLDSNDNYIGQPVKEMELPNNTLVVGHISNQEFVVPGGDTVFAVGDKIIFMGTKQSMQNIQ